MFDLYLWNRHKMRCKQNQPSQSRTASSSSPAFRTQEDKESPSSQIGSNNGYSVKLTTAQIERKKVLEGDPLAINVQQYSVTCKACGNEVKYAMFDLYHWNRHRSRCRRIPSTQSKVGSTSGKGKRFTPLVVHRNPNEILSLNNGLPPSVVSRVDERVPRTSATKAIPSARIQELKVLTSGLIARKASSVPDITLEVDSPTSLSLYHLNFPMSTPIALDQITMPPALSQRKQVARFSIILSYVPFKDLRSCMLVSRMFRYASTAILYYLYREAHY
ncbi:hypothetical protein C8R42DRAFT_186801 [Lentinula raphanica]|nr:hypothetical protein C8R42DRAFT_186801 [Lentinula raphanica]